MLSRIVQKYVDVFTWPFPLKTLKGGGEERFNFGSGCLLHELNGVDFFAGGRQKHLKGAQLVSGWQNCPIFPHCPGPLPVRKVTDGTGIEVHNFLPATQQLKQRSDNEPTSLPDSLRVVTSAHLAHLGVPGLSAVVKEFPVTFKADSPKLLGHPSQTVQLALQA